MSTATEHTDRLFLAATLSDGDRGYPDGASFISQDMEGWEESAIATLQAGKAFVLVDEDGVEVLFEPSPRQGAFGLLDRARGRTRVFIRWRQGDHAYVIDHVSVNRETIEHFRVELQPQVT